MPDSRPLALALLALLGAAAAQDPAPAAGCGPDVTELKLGEVRHGLVELLEDVKYCVRVPPSSPALKVAVAPVYGDADVFLSFKPMESHEDATFVLDGVGMEEMLIRRDSAEFCAQEPCVLYGTVFGFHEASYYIGVFNMTDPTVTDIFQVECAPGCTHFDLTDMECHVECNTTQCLYDGGDCIAAQDLCSPGCMPEYIGDAICDDACFNAECEWDLGDCYEEYQGCSPGCVHTYVDDGECDAVCNVPACGYDGADCFVGHDECYIDARGMDYRGNVNKTTNGHKCQAWSDQYPHQHTFAHSWYPMAGLGGHNYCRNPDGRDRPWCFTQDPGVPWEYCTITVPDTCVSDKAAGDRAGDAEAPNEQGRCPDGSFKVATDSCMPCSECAPGMQERIPCTHTMDRVCAPPCAMEANKFDGHGLGALHTVQVVCGETPNATFTPKSNSTFDPKKICSNNCCITYQLALGACNYDGDHLATWSVVRDEIARQHEKTCPAANECASMTDVLQKLSWQEEMGDAGNSSGIAGGRWRPVRPRHPEQPSKVQATQALSNPMVATIISGLGVGVCILGVAICYYRRRVKATLLYASPNAPDEVQQET